MDGPLQIRQCVNWLNFFQSMCIGIFQSMTNIKNENKNESGNVYRNAPKKSGNV